MTAPETTPELLAEGDIILGARDGVEWEVIEIGRTKGASEDHCGLRRVQDGKVVVVPQSAFPPKITLVSTRVEREQHALALLQVRLGAEVIAQRTGDGPHIVPAAFTDAGAMLSHLYVFHFVKENPKDATTYPPGNLAVLVAEHAKMHESGRIAADHEHSPTFYRDIEARGAGA